MKREVPRSPYFLLALSLFIWAHLPLTVVEPLRSFAIASFSPVWSRIRGGASSEGVELAKLQLENQRLHLQIGALYEWLRFDEKVQEQARLLEEVSEVKKGSGARANLLQKRAFHLQHLLEAELRALPAQVIYRDPSSWSSALWINIGERENEQLEEKIVAKNSPVVSGCHLIGVVEFVGRDHSRIRLLTDAGLHPAVRAARGSLQNRELGGLLESLSLRLEKRGDLFASPEEHGGWIQGLKEIQKRLSTHGNEGYLAKGELQGSSAPFWRSLKNQLKGIGFNLEVDDEGRAKGEPILQEGDLLITSGLDGVFPPGLFVATISSIAPLREGEYFYQIEAMPTYPHFNELKTLFVLPPLTSSPFQD